MKKQLIAFSLIAIASVAQAQMPTTEEVFAANDKNKDGVITKEEADEAGTPLVNFFDMLDTNHDGKLTVDEVKVMLGGGAGGPPPAP